MNDGILWEGSSSLLLHEKKRSSTQVQTHLSYQHGNSQNDGEKISQGCLSSSNG